MGMGTGVCTAPVDSAADRPDVSAGVRTALPQKHHPYPSCPSARVAFPQGAATFRQRRRTQCRTWPLGPSQVLDSLSLSQPTLTAAKPVGLWESPHGVASGPAVPAPRTTARPPESMHQSPAHNTPSAPVPPSCWPQADASCRRRPRRSVSQPRLVVPQRGDPASRPRGPRSLDVFGNVW